MSSEGNNQQLLSILTLLFATLKEELDAFNKLAIATLQIAILEKISTVNNALDAVLARITTLESQLARVPVSYNQKH
jgi:hypothetical protein